MICHLVAVTPGRLEQLGEMGSAGGQELPDALSEEFYDSPDLCFLADKDWQVFNYLLTGDRWGGEPPLGLVMGGCAEHLCEHDFWGYGPPTYLWPSEVREVAATLEAADRGAMRKRFNAAELARHNVYSYSELAPEKEESEWQSLMEQFDALVWFYKQAAEEGRAVIVWLC